MLDAQVIATVGGDPLPLKAFERYLADNAGDSQDDDAEETNAIESRLLDQLLEEQLLLRAAKGLGVTVSESEIDDYLRRRSPVRKARRPFGTRSARVSSSRR